MPRTRKVHDESTKRAALNALARHEPPGKVATAFGVPRTTLYRWIEADKKSNGAARASAPASDDSGELQRLRAENRALKEKLATLKRTIAIMGEA
jgi:transposase-like protein